MEVTVNCSCGARYDFDVELVDGKMPVEISCTECGADITELASEYVQQQHSTAFAPGRELQGEQPATAVTAPVHKPVTPLTQALNEMDAATLRPFTREEPHLALGATGAVVAGLAGMVGWYLLVKLTGYELGIVAWGIGVLIGFATRLLAKTCSQMLGVVAGICAFVAITGGQYLLVKDSLDSYVQLEVAGSYDARMGFAKEALQLETDDQIRSLLAKYNVEPGQTPNVAAVSEEDIAAFRADLPSLREFVAGKPAKAEFEESVERSMREFLSSPETQAAILKESVSPFTLLWLFLGVGSAWKLAAREAVGQAG
jgi:hypothetical protein